MSDQTQSGPLKPPEPLQSKDLLKIQRKLDAWELDHLREHAAALHLQVEALKQEVEQLRNEAYASDARADMFMALANDLQDQHGARIGITRCGHAGVMR